MKKLNLIQIVIALIFVMQIVFALVYAPLSGIVDIYPLHKWALFGQVQKNYRWPIIKIEQWGDQRWQSPINYYDFFFRNHRIDFLPGQDLVFDWFLLREQGRLDEAQHKRQAFERHFFKSAEYVKYSIEVVDLNQLEFMKKRRIQRIQYVEGPFEYRSEKK